MNESSLTYSNVLHQSRQTANFSKFEPTFYAIVSQNINNKIFDVVIEGSPREVM